jgi:hypothetical protein
MLDPMLLDPLSGGRNRRDCAARSPSRSATRRLTVPSGYVPSLRGLPAGTPVRISIP